MTSLSLPIWTPCFPNLLEKRRLLAQNNSMDQRFVIEKLRHHEPELKAAGILHIRVFGSVARNEATTVSDVDLLADFDKSMRMTLVKVGSLQSRLSAMLGARVDLSSTEWMREPVKSKALREAVIAF
jgi:predicted nucleotidyltransferase